MVDRGLQWLIPLLFGVGLVALEAWQTSPALLPVALVAALALLALMRRPEWALYLMVAAWPLNVLSLPVKGLRMKACQALLLLALAGWSLRSVVRRDPVHLPGVLVPFAGFIAIAAATAMGGLAWRTPALLSQWVFFWVTILAVSNLIDRPAVLTGAIAAHLYSGTANALLGIVQSITSHAGLNLFDLYQVGRAQGLFTEPDWFGYYLLSVFFPLLALLAADCWPARRTWMQVSLGVVSLAMLLSQVRAAWVGLALGLLGFLYWYRSRALDVAKRAWLPLLGGVLLIAIFCLADPDVGAAIGGRFDSFADPNETATSYRLFMAESTMAMIWENPLFGYGLGSWGPLVGLTGPNAVGTWNMAMSLWFDTGLFGLGAVLWLFAHVWISAMRAARCTADPMLASLLRGLLLGFAAMVVCNQFSDGSYFDFFWAYIGVISAAVRLARADIPAARQRRA
jgi:hypothetical protein